MILKAWPNMSPVHRPEYEATRKESPEVIRSGKRISEKHTFARHQYRRFGQGQDVAPSLELAR